MSLVEIDFIFLLFTLLLSLAAWSSWGKVAEFPVFEGLANFLNFPLPNDSSDYAIVRRLLLINDVHKVTKELAKYDSEVIKLYLAYSEYRSREWAMVSQIVLALTCAMPLLMGYTATLNLIMLVGLFFGGLISLYAYKFRRLGITIKYNFGAE